MKCLSMAAEFIECRWASTLLMKLFLGSSFKHALAEAEAQAGRPLGAPGMCIASDSTGVEWIFMVTSERLRITAKGSNSEILIFQDRDKEDVVNVVGTALEQYFR